MTRRREHTFVAHEAAETGICDGCGHVFPRPELAWETASWVSRAPDLGRRVRLHGDYTAVLCASCAALGWFMCWHCGRLTAHEDGVCTGCYAEGIGDPR